MKGIILSLLGMFSCFSGKPSEPLTETSIYDFTMKTLSGDEKSLSDYRGKVMIIVNVASKCGLTPQYKDLEETYEKYKDQGLAILGFPANNFLSQEPGSNEEIAEFCQVNYGVTFDMFSKISVKGKDQAPLYQFLTEEKYNHLKDAPVTWNFQKFIIDKNGNIVDVISPKTSIKDSSVIQEVETLLKK